MINGPAFVEAELEEFQRALAARWSAEPRWEPPRGREMLVGGVFVAAQRGGEGPGAAGDAAWAAAVVMQAGHVVDWAVLRGQLDAPYAPGLLAMREGRLLFEAVRRPRQVPEVLLVNATGRDHPRRAGLALHLGAALDVPTVGVTDRPLVAFGGEPVLERGAIAELRLDDEVVGYRLRTRAGARAVVVHAGWRTDAETARSVVLDVARSSRTPAPLREARRLARTARTATRNPSRIAAGATG